MSRPEGLISHRRLRRACGRPTRVGGSKGSPTGLTRSTRSRSCRSPPPNSLAPSRCSMPDAAPVRPVGWGGGQISRLAASLGAEVVGIDPTWNCVTVAAQRGAASFARSEAAALPFADESFDAVVACLVFEHIRDVEEAIVEVARVLHRGGRFCFFLN